MSKTLQSLLAARPWIAHIDDERGDGNSIIVTLSSDYYFVCEPNSGVRGFDTVAEVRAGTNKKQVFSR